MPRRHSHRLFALAGAAFPVVRRVAVLPVGVLLIAIALPIAPAAAPHAEGGAPAPAPTTVPTTTPAVPRYEFLTREGEDDPPPPPETRPTLRAAFGANGGRLMTTSARAVHLWTVPRMKPVVPRLKLKPPIAAADLSPDGRRLVTADGGGWLRMHHVGDAEPRWSRHREGGFRGAAFSPDGRRVLVVERESRTARLLDAATGDPVLAVVDDKSGSLEAAVLTPDGTRIVTDGSLGPTRVWSARTGEPIATLEGGNFILAVSPKGDRVAQARTGSAFISDTATGKVLAETQFDYRGDTQEANLYSVAFSPDGRFVATAAEDVGLRLSDAATGRPVSGYFRLEEVAVHLLFTPDGRQVIVGGVDGASVWNVATGKRIAVMDKTIIGRPAAAIALSPDGRFLAVNFGGPVELWERKREK